MPPKRTRDDDEFQKLAALLEAESAPKRQKTKHVLPIVHGSLINVVSHKKTKKKSAPAFHDFVGPVISIPSQTKKKK